MNRIPICIAIDVEPDLRRVDLDQHAPWAGFEVLCDYISRIRPELAQATQAPVHFTWLLRLDPQIQKAYGTPDWVIRQYGRQLDELQEAGDEIGVHTHAWRWDEDAGQWLVDHGNMEWVEHCQRSSLAVFRTAFGRSPRVTKFGDRFFSNRLARMLDREGILCDLTPEPGQPAAVTLSIGDHTTGTSPDFTAVPHHPYRPSRWNYQRPGRFWKRNLWLIPVTSGPPMPGSAGLPDPPPTVVTMLLGYPFAAIRHLVDFTLMGKVGPLLAAVARSDVMLKPSDGEQFEQFFTYLLEHPQPDRFILESHPAALRRVA